MGACGPSSYFFGEYKLPPVSKKHEKSYVRIKDSNETYLDYVRERKEVEKLLNPKKWWEFWR